MYVYEVMFIMYYVEYMFFVLLGGTTDSFGIPKSPSGIPYHFS